MPLVLNVPFEEKDAAKEKGARWNPELKKWIATNKKYYRRFLPWISSENFYSIVCDQFYIVEGVRFCHKCNKPTRVIGFGIEDYYSIEPDENNPGKLWIDASLNEGCVKIIAHIAPLPAPVEKFIKSNWNYKLGYSRTIGSSYLANHCEHCNAIQGDHFLFAEPNSPFSVDTEQDATKLTLYKIPLTDDLVVDFLELGYSPTEFLIKEHGKIIDSGIEL